MITAQKDEGYYQNTRFEVVDFLSENTYQKILEIGCGAGNTLAKLKEKGITKECYGLEINEDAVESKHPLVDEILVGDITQHDTLGNKKYDLILFLDVLEHLLWPYNVLKMISKNLTSEGSIIISFPNLRYYSVIKKLVFHGSFDYSSYGILDNTHFRFFTIKSFINEINNLNIYNVKKINSIYKKKKRFPRDHILKLFKQNDILTYQYLVELQIKK